MFDEGDGSPGYREPVPEVVGRGPGRGEPVTKPPHNPEGVEEVSVPLDWGSCVGSLLAGSLPVNEFGLGDRKRDG